MPILLQITTLDDLVAFVTLIRGEALDVHKIAEMTARLRTSTAALAAAEATIPPAKP